MALIAPTRASIAANLQKEVGVSHSQLEDYQRCPRRWAYNKILGQDNGEDKESLVLGGAGHAGLEGVGRGATLQQAVELAFKKVAEEAPPGAEYIPRVKERLPLHLEGFMKMFWPGFLAKYDILNLEQYAKYLLYGNVYWRGAIDLIVRERQTGGIFILDYKFAGDMYVSNLTGMVQSSPQLAAYTMASVRVLLGQWPAGVGYVFLKKLKKNENPKNLVQDPTKYQLLTTPITPALVSFALSAEKNTVLLASQVRKHFEDYANYGLASIDMLPARYDGCNMFNSWCGYSKGCLAGCPLHTTLKAQD